MPLRKGVTLNTSTVHTLRQLLTTALSATKKFTFYALVAVLMYPLKHKIENHHHQGNMIWIIQNYISVLHVFQLKYHYITEINKELPRMIQLFSNTKKVSLKWIVKVENSYVMSCTKRTTVDTSCDLNKILIVNCYSWKKKPQNAPAMKHAVSFILPAHCGFYISIVLIIKSVFNEAVLNKSQLEMHSNAYKSILIVSIQADCWNAISTSTNLGCCLFFNVLNAAASFV